MSENLPLKIYAMVGAMGSGKTTMALRISRQTGAKFFSLDKTIKDFNLPINSLEDYESHMARALELIGSSAIQNLKNNQSVVFDFGGGLGHWQWLKNISDVSQAFVEIYHFNVPLDVRLARVKKRNEEKPKDVYHFTMTEDEVIASKSSRETPPASEKTKIIKVTE